MIRVRLYNTFASKLAQNAGWMIVGQILSVLFQAAYFVLLARLLGSVQYGIYAGAFALVSLFSPYSPLGSHFVMLRHVSQNHGHFRAYWGNTLLYTVTLGSLFVGLLTWLGPHAAPDYSRALIVFLAISDCLCAQLADIASRVFQAFERLRTTAFLSLLINFLRLCIATVMLWRLHHGNAQEWALATMLVSVVATITALTLVTRHYGWPFFDLSLARERAGEGVVFALSSSTSVVYNSVDKAMLGHYGMNADNGVYSMAYRVIDIATIPVTAIHAAAFPRFFREGANGPTATRAYALQILRRTAPLTLAITVSLLVSAPLIPFLTGRSFTGSVSALRWLALIPVFRAFQLSGGDALTGAGFLRVRLCIQAAAALFNFSLNLWWIPRYGWHGAAWSSLLTDGCLALFNWITLIVLERREKHAPSL